LLDSCVWSKLWSRGGAVVPYDFFICRFGISMADAGMYLPIPRWKHFLGKIIFRNPLLTSKNLVPPLVGAQQWSCFTCITSLLYGLYTIAAWLVWAGQSLKPCGFVDRSATDSVVLSDPLVANLCWLFRLFKIFSEQLVLLL